MSGAGGNALYGHNIGGADCDRCGGIWWRNVMLALGRDRGGAEQATHRNGRIRDKRDQLVKF